MICIQPFHSSVWSRWSGFAAAASPESRSVSSPITSSSKLTPQKCGDDTCFGPLAISVVRSQT